METDVFRFLNKEFFSQNEKFIINKSERLKVCRYCIEENEN